MTGEATKRRTDSEFVDAMRYLLYEHEPETEEEIDAFLRSEGIDPEAVAVCVRDTDTGRPDAV
jgi:hypothetical protein